MRITVWAIVTTLVLPTAPSRATTIRVPEDVPSVLAAVDAAAQGDSVLVGPGTWADKETRLVLEDGFPTQVTACAFPTHGMTIIGTSGAEATVLDAGGTGAGALRVISFRYPGPERLVIEGITLTGMAGSSYGYGIRATNSDGVVVRGCRFVGDLAGAEEYAIQIRGGDSEVLSTEFTLHGGQGSVVSLLDGGLEMRECLFQQNIGKCVQIENEFDSSPVIIQECEFTQNRGPGLGVCLDLLLVSNLHVRENLFLENTAEEFYCAALRVSDCNATVEFNVFAFDSCLVGNGIGAGLSWESSIGSVSGNTFVGCHGYLDAAAVVVFGASSLVYEQNVVSSTTGSAAVSDMDKGVVSNACNLYWSNNEGDFGDWTPSPTDIFYDPLFCDLAKMDFTVREDSPCVVGGCGQIGALGVGCKNVSLDPLSWGKIKGLYRLGR